MTPLITPAELAELLDSDCPPLVLDARYLGPAATQTGEGDFLSRHIPGSFWVDVDDDLAAHPAFPGASGGRHPLPSAEAFTASMRRLGVSSGRSVVVTDGANSLAAARLWWMLEDAGHPDVRVLDGGVAAWAEAGLPLVSGETGRPEPGDFTARPGQLPQVSAEEIASGALGEERTLWDVRAPERYRGESEPIDPVAGHIPGAKNLPAAENHEEDGRLKSPAELAKNFSDVRPGDAVYCGSGITAAQSLLAMRAAGIEGVALYAGSWSDWITDPARPVSPPGR